MAWHPTIVNIEGYRTNKRTLAMHKEAEKLGGNLVVVQGSYHKGVAASGGTHDEGGVLDYSVRGLIRAQIDKRVKALRRVGFAAWYRPALPGVWGPHIHAVAIGTRDLAPLARLQVLAYKKGLSGLRGGRKDIHAGLHTHPTTFEAYLRSAS
jgi:hypothetical protein